jgi:hypothetical protein
MLGLKLTFQTPPCSRIDTPVDVGLLDMIAVQIMHAV